MTAEPEHPVVQGELAELRRRLDVAYARSWSPLLELQILLKTILVVLKKQNAY